VKQNIHFSLLLSVIKVYILKTKLWFMNKYFCPDSASAWTFPEYCYERMKFGISALKYV